MTIQDEVEEFIELSLSGGLSKREIIEEIASSFEGFDRSLASDAYEDWERDNDPSNEEATVGDMEQFIDDMLVEGFPEDQAFERAAKRFNLSVNELRRAVESSKALSLLDRIEEAVDKYDAKLRALKARRDPDNIESDIF